MARKSKETVISGEALAPVPAGIAQDMTNSALVAQDDGAREEQARALAERMGYEGSLAEETLWESLRMRMRRTVEETLEVGRIALLLKLRMRHGEFGPELERRGLNRRVIGRFMQAAAKFHGAGEKLAQIPGMSQTKLLELVVLDDEDTTALIETGEIPGLPEDAIECMSVSELKAALRERDARLAAKDKVIGDNAKSMARLQEQIASKPAPSPEFRAEEALRALDQASLLCAAHIEADLRGACARALEADLADDKALARQGMAAALGRVLAAARHLAADFGVALTGPGADPAAVDEAAEDAELWSAVNAEMGQRNGSGH